MTSNRISTKTRQCVNCKREYAPTGNRQSRCQACRQKVKPPTRTKTTTLKVPPTPKFVPVPLPTTLTAAGVARELGKKTLRDLRVGKHPSALDVQAGGDHYKTMAIQPIQYAEANKLSACEFAIVKYISRHRVKGGRLDLEKARHCIDLLEELAYGSKHESV